MMNRTSCHCQINVLQQRKGQMNGEELRHIGTEGKRQKRAEQGQGTERKQRPLECAGVLQARRQHGEGESCFRPGTFCQSVRNVAT
jgi:hypothetical protein